MYTAGGGAVRGEHQDDGGGHPDLHRGPQARAGRQENNELVHGLLFGRRRRPLLVTGLHPDRRPRRHRLPPARALREERHRHRALLDF